MNYKVLTLWQPWAILFAYGIKEIETRPGPTNWTKEKGAYLIHAALKWTKEQYNICMEEPFFSELLKINAIKFIPEDNRFALNLPLGSIIGSVLIEGCYRIYYNGNGDAPIYFTGKSEGHMIYGKELKFGNYANGRYAWISKNHRILKTPQPYKNGQGYYQNFKGDINRLIFL